MYALDANLQSNKNDVSCIDTEHKRNMKDETGSRGTREISCSRSIIDQLFLHLSRIKSRGPGGIFASINALSVMRRSVSSVSPALTKFFSYWSRPSDDSIAWQVDTKTTAAETRNKIMIRLSVSTINALPYRDGEALPLLCHKRMVNEILRELNGGANELD